MEILDYEGDGEDAARLIERAWSETYRQSMWFPLWDAEFLRWQLGAGDRRLCVAAYDGDKIVGTFFSLRHQLRIGATVYPATLSSWCTVAPEYRTPRLVMEMTEALARRHEETGQALSIGVVSGDRHSLAYRFWSKYAQTFPQRLRFLSKFGLWVKVLEPAALARAGIAPWERWGARLVGPALRVTPGRPSDSLRPYRPGDREQCAQIVARAAAGFDWSLVWSPEQLSRQLEGPVPRTLVFEQDGRVTGLLNYHLLWFQGRERVRTALIDIWAAPDLDTRQRARFLGSVCHRLRGDGVHLVLALRSSMCPAAPFLANAFLPVPAQGHLVILFPQARVPLTPPRTWSLLMR